VINLFPLLKSCISAVFTLLAESRWDNDASKRSSRVDAAKVDSTVSKPLWFAFVEIIKFMSDSTYDSDKTNPIGFTVFRGTKVHPDLRAVALTLGRATDVPRSWDILNHICLQIQGAYLCRYGFS
jgi:hypothetical protein